MYTYQLDWQKEVNACMLVSRWAKNSTVNAENGEKQLI